MLGAWVPVLDTDQHRAQRGPDLAREPHILPGVESGPWYSWSRRLVIAIWGERAENWDIGAHSWFNTPCLSG